MRKLFLLFFVAAALTAGAQKSPAPYTWEARPALHAADAAHAEEPAVYLADNRQVEYVLGKDGFYMYKTVHKIVRINNDKGIEGFNKIYLPYNEGLEMVDVRARTILPGGKVLELDRNNIKDLKDDDGEYKIFALDGLVKGCEVEFYYTIKKEPVFFGREVLGSALPLAAGRFTLIAPDHLIFETKSFNRLPDSKVTEKDGKRFLEVSVSSLPGLEKEKYSMYQAALQRVEYKLSYNKGRNEDLRLFTWNELAKNVYTIYNTLSDKERKKVADLLRATGAAGKTGAEAILAIEHYVKKNFIIRDDVSGDDAEDLIKVINGKVASEKAAGKVLVSLLNAAGIENEVVLCGDRSDFGLEPGFENWNNTQNLLIHFPSTGKFLSPTSVEFRYPFIPPTWTGTNGLFCVGTTIGQLTTAIGEVRPIEPESYDLSYHNMEVKARLDDKGEGLILDTKQLLSGYLAPSYKAPFAFLPEEAQQDMLKELAKNISGSDNILSHSFENREMESDPLRPFVIHTSVKSDNLVEQAGSKLLLKFGALIGQQTEMYDTQGRTTVIDVTIPHALHRTITFQVPKGYAVRNLQDLAIRHVVEEGGRPLMGFVSSYKLEGDLLKVEIREDYYQLLYPVTQYDNFKKIINAAADYNKIVLILEKA